jgi:SAM-dependent methyltransferase
VHASEGPRHAQPDNLDPATVDGFGVEWQRFDHSGRPSAELDAIFADYFSLFRWELLPDGAEGFDVGCGSGRWAARVAPNPKVGKLHCIDASPSALEVARRNVASFSNCELHLASVDALPLADGSQDFGYSLGVLHHVPDTRAGLAACVRKLKPGAPFLVYLYYSLDNRAAYYRAVWRASDAARRSIAALPERARTVVSDVIAATVYWPLARTARLVERLGFDPAGIPLAWYRDRTFYVMRNDALDRFGTQLEQRFSRAEILQMLEGAGLERIAFREGPPYWCAIGYKPA